MAYDDDFEDEQETTPQPLDPNIRKQLREAEKARKELEALRGELEAQKREVEFTKAGIPDSGVGQLFRKAYDGEANLEAIRQAAEQYGIIQSGQSESSSIDAELAAQRRAQGATIGTTGAMPDPQQEYLAALAAAERPEDVMRIIESGPGKSLGLSSSRTAY